MHTSVLSFWNDIGTIDDLIVTLCEARARLGSNVALTTLSPDLRDLTLFLDEPDTDDGEIAFRLATLTGGTDQPWAASRATAR